jgi:hypothetical protein
VIAAPAAAPVGVETLLGSRRWARHERPFPHYVVRDVFAARTYAELCGEFARLLGPGDASTSTQFARAMPGYDASGYFFGPDLDGPLSIFVSRAWRDLLSAAVGVDVTDHVSGALHHHRVGSADGEMHTDYSTGWFVEERTTDDGMIVADNTACGYWTGEPHRLGVRPRELIRAIAVLYYLANPTWQPGDGGATGLYASATDPLRAPAARIPPVSNSMVVFECSPWSYHSFLRNRRAERNCVAMFLHRRREDAVARWGARRITGGPEPATGGSR